MGVGGGGGRSSGGWFRESVNHRKITNIILLLGLIMPYFSIQSMSHFVIVATGRVVQL